MPAGWRSFGLGFLRKHIITIHRFRFISTNCVQDSILGFPMVFQKLVWKVAEHWKAIEGYDSRSRQQHRALDKVLVSDIIHLLKITKRPLLTCKILHVHHLLCVL